MWVGDLPCEFHFRSVKEVLNLLAIQKRCWVCRVTASAPPAGLSALLTPSSRGQVGPHLLWKVPHLPCLCALGSSLQRLDPASGAHGPLSGGPSNCLGSRQCFCSENLTCRFFWGSQPSQGCLLPLGQGPEARAKLLNQSLWESLAISGQRPSSEPPTTRPGAPGHRPPAVFLDWADLGWTCSRDSQREVTGPPSSTMSGEY